MCFAPSQRTCSFGGFDLTNRSLHVVNSGTEANVSSDESHGLSRPGPSHHTDSHLFLFSLDSFS